MALVRLTDRVSCFEHQPQLDRPMLGHVRGDRFSLAVDAGFSPAHVREFDEALRGAGLRAPDFTAITHWHWDHTFGMHSVTGATVASRETNAKLREVQAELADPKFVDALWEGSNAFGPVLLEEYSSPEDVVIDTADIEFEDRIVFDLGGVSAELSRVEAPHTDDSVLVFVPDEGALFLGDSICEDYETGDLDRAKFESLVGVIQGIDCEYCLLGHDVPLTKKELLGYLATV